MAMKNILKYDNAVKICTKIYFFMLYINKVPMV